MYRLRYLGYRVDNEIEVFIDFGQMVRMNQRCRVCLTDQCGASYFVAGFQNVAFVDRSWIGFSVELDRPFVDHCR